MPPARTVAAPEMSPEPLAAVQAEPADAAQVQATFVSRVASKVSATVVDRVARPRVRDHDGVGERASGEVGGGAVGLGDLEVGDAGRRVGVGRSVVSRGRVGDAGGEVTVAVLTRFPVARQDLAVMV